MPKKRRQNPTHSQMGNPYPGGLEPVAIKYGIPGIPMERCSTRPLVEAEVPRPGGIVADYLYVEPDPRWPRLKLRLAPRGKRETDEQYEAYRRNIEEFTCSHAVYLGFCQELCTLLGSHHACAEGPCRRTGACAGIRDQDRFDIPLVLFPPCVPLDREIIETYRREIVAEIRRLVAKENEEPKAEPAARPAPSRRASRRKPAAVRPPSAAPERKDHCSLRLRALQRPHN